MKTCFFTTCSDKYFAEGGGRTFVNSFTRFHPDIDLIVYRQNTIDDELFYECDTPYKTINGKKKVSFGVAKAYYGRKLADKYEKVINMDADQIITGRLDSILADDWEVGGAWNLNDYENAFFDNITAEMYVHAGMIGSTKPLFWDRWAEYNLNFMGYKRKENDTLNLTIYNDPEIKKMKLKIFDKEKDYYGCKSLNREKEMYVENNELMLRGEKVKCYHHAKGGKLPKLRFHKMGFTPEVATWLYQIGDYGQSYISRGL